MTQTANRQQANRQMAVDSTLGADKLLMLGMRGSEALGRMFQYELEVFSQGGTPVTPKSILGTNMTIRLLLVNKDGNAENRYFNGMVSRFVLTSVDQTKGAGIVYNYRVTLVPWLWFLTRAAGCRIFQTQTVPEIIQSIFSDYGGDIKDSLTDKSKYRKWDYCVQYRETDFNFVSRLMENEGIYYYFEHEQGKHTLVLCDAPTAHAKVKHYEKLIFDQPDKGEDADAYAWNWVHENELTSSAYALTDYNYTTPGTNLYNTIQVQNTDDTSRSELYDYPGMYTTPDEGRFYAKNRIEEVAARYSIATAASSARGVGIGNTFEFDGHPIIDPPIDFLVTAASYQLTNDTMGVGGRSDGPLAPTFQSQITVIPATIPFRPARITPKPSVQGPQTAVVVGKSGEEIWTDEYGSVKVKFFWDPAAECHENSSCWVRVSQNWAGKNYGIFFAPRIGQEVIVDFLEGDPDRPIITGRVYNKDNEPPYPLPAKQTISTIKSNTSKGGGGFNEFRFEDNKDNQQIFIHAEKNMDIRVKNDRFENILHDRHLVVVNNKFEHVKQKRNELIDSDHIEHIKGDYNQNIDGKEAKSVTGSKSLVVTKDVIEQFKANHNEVVTADYYLKADNICIEALTNVTIKVGKNYIAIEKDGIKIGVEESGGTVETSSTGDTTFKATGNLNIEATQKLDAKGTAGATFESPATVDVKSAKVTVNADSMLTLKGGTVMIN